MARTKPKRPPTNTELAAKVGVTVERFVKDDFDRDKATVRTGAKVEHPPRQRSRLCRFHSDGWIDDAGFAALARYEELVDASGYGHQRSCLDMTPVGGDTNGPSPVVLGTRAELARVRNHVQASVPSHALILLDAMIWPDPLHRHETPSEIAHRLIGGSKAHRYNEAKRLVGMVAECMVVAMAGKGTA